MDAAITRFIRLLKRNGVGVSPSESIDAMNGLLCAALGDRETVRTVLRATLIKDLHEIPVFDALFDLFFALPGARESRSGHDDGDGAGEQAEPGRIAVGPDDAGAVGGNPEPIDGEPVSMLDISDLDKMVVRSNPPQDPDELRLTSLTQRLILNRDQGMLDQLMEKVTHVLHGRRVKNVARPGDLNFAEALAQIDEELIVSAVEALLDDLSDLAVENWAPVE